MTYHLLFNHYQNLKQQTEGFDMLKEDPIPNKTSKNQKCRLPAFGPFVGRARELTKLQKFLKNSDTKKPIMLVYGPRGVGKSAFVREAACRSYKQGNFNKVLWLDRTWASELLLPDGNSTLEATDKKVERPVDITKNDEYKFLHKYTQKRDDNNSPAEAVKFMREQLKTEPYLLIIDDFDEYDGLGAEIPLCAILARIQSPNKVILTTRVLEDCFDQPVYKKIEVGLLSETEVKELVHNHCDLEQIDAMQLVDRGNLEATADYIWKISGGLSEFILRFFMPMLEQQPWPLGRSKKWLEAYKHFSAGYLSGREQEKLPGAYAKKHTANIEQCRKEFQKLSDEERYILLALAHQKDTQPLEEAELAQTIWYYPDGKDDRGFRNLLFNLHQKRLLGRRYEQANSTWKWLLFPFSKDFLKDHLMDNEDVENDFQKKQAYHWIRFTKGNEEDSRRVDSHLKEIFTSFSWCIKSHEWECAIHLGKALGKHLWNLGFQIGKPEQKKQFIEVCQETAKAAKNINDWKIMVQQWLQLARIHLEAQEDQTSSNLGIQYAEEAIRYLEESQEGDNGEEWIVAAQLIAEIHLRNSDISQSKYWLDKIEAKPIHLSVWLPLAYQFADLLSQQDVKQGIKWRQKILDISYEYQEFNVTTIRVGVDLAHLFLVQENTEQALLYVQKVREIVSSKLSTQEKEVIEYLIKAISIEAQIAYYSDNIEGCAMLLKEARDIAKNNALHSIKEKLQETLIYISFHGSKFDPVSQVDQCLGTNLLWGIFEDKQICPLCKEKIHSKDVFEQELWLCPNCKTYHHIHCLIEYDNKCQICMTPYIETKTQQGATNYGSP